MKNSNNDRERDQRTKTTAQQGKKEEMGNRGSATPAATIGTTDRMRPPKKEELEQMQRLARYITDNTYGGSAGLIGTVTIETTITTMEEIKATKEITKGTRAIPTETIAIRDSPREPTPVTWMSTGT